MTLRRFEKALLCQGVLLCVVSYSTCRSISSLRNLFTVPLQIYDGTGNKSKLVGTYCGSTPPSVIMSTTTTLIVKLIARASNSGSGFKAQYAVECGRVYRTEFGLVSSVDADGDGQYDPYLLCTWIIIADKYQNIEFTITSIDIQYKVEYYSSVPTCVYDKLRVSK